MDTILEKRINEAIEQINRMTDSPIDYRTMDPIAKMMLVSLIHECQKLQDYVDGMEQKIVDRFCECFIPGDKIVAMPAITLIEPKIRQNSTDPVTIENGALFCYKSANIRSFINYVPLFRSVALPYDELYVLTPDRAFTSGASYPISMGSRNCLWVGVHVSSRVETLKGVTLLIRGTSGLMPSNLRVGTSDTSIAFADMSRMEELEMVEPFDAQQSSERFFTMLDNWKDILLDPTDGTLLCITDPAVDRDLYRLRSYPRIFQHWLESEVLDCFKDGTLWLQIEYPEGYEIPTDCSVVVNAVPVVNVDVNTLTLTPTAPIAKLQKQDDAFFLQVLETSGSTHKQGFAMSAEEVIVRDFDASCYHNGDLYRDVRNLYNHFIDDYYAFIEYNGIKDGETIRLLRETINKIGKSVGSPNPKYKFDSGTYVMKNMNQFPPSAATAVSYTTTMGKAGNAPRAGETMINRKLPTIEKEVRIIVPARGGSDKASADERYELLRYYTLTNDRLYSRKDIDAFLRKELIREFGKEEFRRIIIRMNIEGAAGTTKVQRGLYVDLEFKDRKNYDHAVDMAFDRMMQQRIRNLSCIAMPVIITLRNLEE